MQTALKPRERAKFEIADVSEDLVWRLGPGWRDREVGKPYISLSQAMLSKGDIFSLR